MQLLRVILSFTLLPLVLIIVGLHHHISHFLPASAGETDEAPPHPFNVQPSSPLSIHTPPIIYSNDTSNNKKFTLASFFQKDGPRLCEREEIIHGQWKSVALKRRPYIMPVVELQCRDIVTQKTKPYMYHEWVPDTAPSCELTPWHKVLFCKILKKATILIVGDSLSFEHYTSLVELTGSHLHHGLGHQSKFLNMNIDSPVCNGHVRVTHRRDERLLNLSASLLDREPDFFPQVLVLNRGAHYANDTVLLENIRENLKYVKIWLNECDDLGIKCHFFWRTTTPGHPQCQLYDGPVNNLTQMEEWVGSYSYAEKMTKYQ